MVLCTAVAFASQSIASIAVLATRQAVRRIRVLTCGASTVGSCAVYSAVSACSVVRVVRCYVAGIATVVRIAQTD